MASTSSYVRAVASRRGNSNAHFTTHLRRPCYFVDNPSTMFSLLLFSSQEAELENGHMIA
jgi:hypothetical protein